MLVYRVEHATTRAGAYKFLSCIVDAGSSQPCPTGDYRWKAQDAHYSQLAACWHTKELQGRHAEWYFGCQSLKQARRWFGGATADRMRKSKAVVRVYRVPRRAVLKGFEQVAFRMDKAECIATLDPAIITKPALTTAQERELQVQAYVEAARSAGYQLSPIKIVSQREARCFFSPAPCLPTQEMPF